MALSAARPWPHTLLLSTGSAPAFGAAVTLDSTTGKDLGFVWYPPQDDTITGIKFKLTGVTGTPGVLRVSGQGVSTANGLNDGTIKGASSLAYVDFTPVAGDVGVYTATFGESFAATAGDPVSFVIKPQSGTWDASNLVTAIYRLSNVGSRYNPYAINNGAKATSSLQQIIIIGTNRNYECCLSATGATVSLASGGSPNEAGNYFVAPADWDAVDCYGFVYSGSVTAVRNLTAHLRSGTTSLSNKDYDTDRMIAGFGVFDAVFPAVALTPGAAYHVSILGAHATNSTTIHTHSWASSADRLAAMLGFDMYYAERSGGAWSYDQAKIACVFPLLANPSNSGAGLSASKIGPGVLVR